jgi:hypothetical protein
LEELNIPHYHNQPKQHRSEAKTPLPTTKSKLENNLKQKTNPTHNPRSANLEKPTTTQNKKPIPKNTTTKKNPLPQLVQ